MQLRRADHCRTLKHVPDLLVLAIVILAVAGQNSLHDSIKGIVLRLDQEMNVVRHQAIGVDRRAAWLSVARGCR